MENLQQKNLTLTIYAWTGFLLIIAGVVILIMGLVPNDPFIIEYEKFKMSTPQTGLVLVFVGAFIGYLATKSTAGQTTTYSSKTIPGRKFRSNMYTIFIIAGIIAFITFFVLYFLNF